MHKRPVQSSQTITQSIANEDWPALAMLMNKIDLNDIHDRKLRRKMHFIRGVLHTNMSGMNGHGTVDAKMLMGSLKTLYNLEKEFKGDASHEFLIFLRMFIYKLETQKLQVNKTLEKRLEFKRMKVFVES